MSRCRWQRTVTDSLRNHRRRFSSPMLFGDILSVRSPASAVSWDIRWQHWRSYLSQELPYFIFVYNAAWALRLRWRCSYLSCYGQRFSRNLRSMPACSQYRRFFCCDYSWTAATGSNLPQPLYWHTADILFVTLSSTSSYLLLCRFSTGKRFCDAMIAAGLSSYCWGYVSLLFFWTAAHIPSTDGKHTMP